MMCGAGLRAHRAGCPHPGPLSSAPRAPGSGRPGCLSLGRPSALPTSWCLGASGSSPVASTTLWSESRPRLELPAPSVDVFDEYVHTSSLSHSLKEFVVQGWLVECMASVSIPDTRVSPHSPACRPLPGTGRERAGEGGLAGPLPSLSPEETKKQGNKPTLEHVETLSPGRGPQGRQAAPPTVAQATGHVPLWPLLGLKQPGAR